MKSKISNYSFLLAVLIVINPDLKENKIYLIKSDYTSQSSVFQKTSTSANLGVIVLTKDDSTGVHDYTADLLQNNSVIKSAESGSDNLAEFFDVFTNVKGNPDIPFDYYLTQNFPNPFQSINAVLFWCQGARACKNHHL